MLYFYSNSTIGRLLNQLVYVGSPPYTVAQFYGLQGLLFVVQFKALFPAQVLIGCGQRLNGNCSAVQGAAAVP